MKEIRECNQNEKNARGNFAKFFMAIENNQRENISKKPKTITIKKQTNQSDERED